MESHSQTQTKMSIEQGWEALRAELDPHQRANLEFMWAREQPDAPHMRGAVIADEMGGGKTRTAVAYMWHATYVQRRFDMLLVRPGAAMPAFAKEFAWVAGVTGRAMRATPFASKMHAHLMRDVLCITPEMLCRAWSSVCAAGAAVPTGKRLRTAANARARAATAAELALFSREFHAALFDEVHAVRNHATTGLYDAFQGVRAGARFGMTGTIAQAHALPNLCAVLSALACRHVGEAEAREVAKVVITRVRLADLATDNARVQLPPLTERVEYIDATPEWRAVYDAMPRGFGNDVMRRLFCVSPGAVGRGGGGGGVPELKFERVVALCARGPTVVFSQWVKGFGTLAGMFPEGTKVGVYTGKSKSKSKNKSSGASNDTAEVERQMRDGGLDVLLCSTRKGAVALDMTAFCYGIFLDAEFNPSMHTQAVARLHRPGQKHPVEFVTLLMRATIDEEVYWRERERARVAAEVINTMVH